MTALTVKLEPDQLRELAVLVAAELRGTAGDGSPLTVQQAARRLNLSTDTVRRRIEAGQIRTIPLSKPIRIPADEITRLTK